MSRWGQALDDPVISDGDRFFDGWNSKLHRALLPEGTVAVSKNKRFTDKRASPRKGTTMPNGNRFWYAADNSQKFLGSGLYIRPDGGERIVICPSTLHGGTVGVNCYDVANDVYHTIALPPGMTIGPNSIVWFASAFGNLIMLVSDRWHGQNTPHLTNGLFWNGDESPAGAVFQWFQWNGNPELQVIPPSVYAFPLSGRMAYAVSYLPPGPPPAGPETPGFAMSGTVYDHLLMSDEWGSETGAFQNMDPILQDFIVNPETTDIITGVIQYAFDAAIIGMRRSVNMLTNFSVDPNLATLEVLTNYIGFVGPRAYIQLGSEVYFMGERRGVFRLTEILDKRIVATPLPDSDDIQPDIDRINWQFASKIVFATEDNYLYVAAPIDGSVVCNAIFVKNLTTNKWETIDSFPNTPFFGIDNIVSVHINGVRRLVAIQNGPPALIYLLYEGTLDQTLFNIINPAFSPIPDYIETRGYGLNKDLDSTAWATFDRGSVVVETIAPSFSITGITEGVNETKALRTNVTKDRTKYYIHGVPPIADPTDEKRQDYSIPITNPGNYEAQDFEQMPVGPISVDNQIIPPVQKPGNDPWQPPAQTTRERFPIRMTDRWISFGIGNNLGTCTIVATAVEFRESRRSARTAA